MQKLTIFIQKLLISDWKLLIFDWKSVHNEWVLNLLWLEIFQIDLATMKCSILTENCPFLTENNEFTMSVFWTKMMILNLLWFEIFKIDLTTMKWYLSGQYRIYKERSLVCWCCFHHYWMILLLWSTLVGTLNFPNHQLGKSKYVCQS